MNIWVMTKKTKVGYTVRHITAGQTKKECWTWFDLWHIFNGSQKQAEKAGWKARKFKMTEITTKGKP